MTVSTETVVDSPVLGIDVTATYTDGVPQFPLLRKIQTTVGTYRFCRTTKALSLGSVYRINDDGTVAEDVYGGTTSTSNYAPALLGTPVAAIAAPSGVTYNYCWLQTAGTFANLRCCSGTAEDNPLYLSSSYGALTSISSAVGSVVVEGVKYTGASAVTGGAGTSALSACFSNLEMFIPREIA